MAEQGVSNMKEQGCGSAILSFSNSADLWGDTCDVDNDAHVVDDPLHDDGLYGTEEPLEVVAALPELSRAMASLYENQATTAANTSGSTDARRIRPVPALNAAADVKQHNAERARSGGENGKAKLNTAQSNTKGKGYLKATDTAAVRSTNPSKMPACTPSSGTSASSSSAAAVAHAKNSRKLKKRKRWDDRPSQSQGHSSNSSSNCSDHYYGPSDRHDHYARVRSDGPTPSHNFHRHTHANHGPSAWNAGAASRATRDMEEQWHVRRHEMEALSVAQATKQRELDGQTVALEVRERELQERQRSLDCALAEREDDCKKQRHEIKAERQRSREEIEKDRQELEQEREDFKALRSSKMRELTALRKQQDREVDEQLTAIQIQRDELTRIRGEQSRELDAKRDELARERLDHERTIESFQQERNHHMSMLNMQQTELENRKEAQKARESAWDEKVSSDKAAHATMREKLNGRAAKLAKRHQELQELEMSLQIAQARQQEEYQGWAVSKSKQQEDIKAWMQDVKSAQQARQNELDTRAAAQAKLQLQLDTRAKALKKLASDGRPPKPKAGVERANSATSSKTSVHQTGKKDRSSSTEDSTHVPRAQKSNQRTDNHFVLVDSDSENDDKPKIKRSDFPPEETNRKEAAAKPAAQCNEYNFARSGDYNFGMTEEAAKDMQERLFREAAARMRTQPAVRVSDPRDVPTPVLITTPIFDIADRYPQHWTWKDPYAVLGLPSDASLQLVKSQFRRLARRYHPDKSTDLNSSAKFHSIASVYHKLVQALST